MDARLRRATPIAALGAALAIAACGGDGGDTDSGPASLVPADAPIYFDATVRPEGAAKTDAEAALGKIVQAPDPSAKLITLIEQDAQTDLKPGETFSFAEDIEPWLGQKAAVFATSFAEGEEPTFVIESTDNAAALESLQEDAGVSSETKEYNGHEYRVDSSDNTVVGEVGDFIVSGPQTGFEAAVDASEGDSLGDSDGFTDSVDDLPEDRLGTFYVDPKDFLAALPDDDLDAETRGQVQEAAGDALDQPVVGDVTASAEEIQINLSAGSTGVETPASALLESVPSQAWLAIGLGGLGDAITNGFKSLENADIPNFDADTVRSQIQLATGHDIEEIAGALGNGALFVEGTSQRQLQGALIVESKDTTVTSDLISRLQSVLQADDPKETVVVPLAGATGATGFNVIDRTGELQQPVTVAQKGDKLSIAYGPAASAQALGVVPQPLSSTPAFSAAQSKLSDLGVDAFLSFAPVFELAQASGEDVSSARPYIDGLDYLALGSGEADDRADLSIVIGLK